MNAERPLTGAVFLVLVGIGLGTGFNALHPKPLPWKAEKKTTVTLPPGESEETSSGDPADRAEAEHPTDPAGTPPQNEKPELERGTTPPAGKSTADAATPSPTTSKLVHDEDVYSDIPESEFPINVGLAQAKEFFDRGGLLVLDAREHEEFAAGHLAGALSAYADEMMGDLEWLDKTAKDPRPILVYCDGGDCELSLNLGFELTQSGHRKVLVFTDGYPAWKDAGYPIATGDMP